MPLMPQAPQLRQRHGASRARGTANAEAVSDPTRQTLPRLEPQPSSGAPSVAPVSTAAVPPAALKASEPGARVAAMAQTAAIPGPLPAPMRAEAELGLVLIGLGLDREATGLAIQSLPAAVSFSFMPAAPQLAAWIEAAKAAGHEVLIDLPLGGSAARMVGAERVALYAGFSPFDNLQRLEWTLGRYGGAVGVSALVGRDFMAAPDHLEMVMRRLSRTQMVVFDAVRGHPGGPGEAVAEAAFRAGVAYGEASMLIDGHGPAATTEAQLRDLIDLTRRRGAVVAALRGHVVLIRQLALFTQRLPRHRIRLMPLSAFAG